MKRLTPPAALRPVVPPVAVHVRLVTGWNQTSVTDQLSALARLPGVRDVSVDARHATARIELQRGTHETLELLARLGYSAVEPTT